MDWRNKPNQIFNKIKLQLFGKGVQTFRFADQFVREFDPEGKGALTSHAFNLLLNKIGVFLSTQQIRNVRDLYQPAANQDLILYRDFFEDVKYSIPENVAAIINLAFDSIDRNQQGAVSLKDLQTHFNADGHPHVISRRKSPEEVRHFFLDRIASKAELGVVSRKNFVDYYAQLNFCIPNQRASYFEQLLTGTWNLGNPHEHVSEKRLGELQKILYEKIRLKSDGKTNQWKTGKKAMSYFDLGDNQQSDFTQFKHGLDKFGCVFKEWQLRALFNKYSADGRVSYESFVKAIMDIDISGLSSKQNFLQTKMGTNHFSVKH